MNASPHRSDTRLSARQARTIAVAATARIRDRVGTVIDALRLHATVPIVADLLDRADAHTIATTGA